MKKAVLILCVFLSKLCFSEPANNSNFSSDITKNALIGVGGYYGGLAGKYGQDALDWIQEKERVKQHGRTY